jgi:mannitol operon transcriptional antiterminator
VYISARERQLLKTLLSHQEEITVRNLAEQIGVSERTIHRDLKNIEDILREYDLTLEKKSGVGIQLTGDRAKLLELELFLFQLSHTEYTPDERKTIILCELLETNGPIKLFSLANDLNVTIATVSADLTKLEEKLQTFDLSLIRRRGYGVEIKGGEEAKRRAMSYLISKYLDESDLLSLTRGNIQKKSTSQIQTISERLMGLVEKKKLVMIEKVVESVIQELPFSMADSAFVGLIVHLGLAIERIQKGEAIAIDQSYLKRQQATKEYKFAKKIGDKLGNLFHIDIPDIEIAYITMHLKGAKLRHDKEYLLEESGIEVAKKAKQLIDTIGKHVGSDLSKNQSLFEGLVLHLKPALYRMKQGMRISNPLLDKIKRDYADLFTLVKQSANQVLTDSFIPDEEVGYIVMHFGAALMGRNDKLPLKTLVICSSGIGTSKLLVTKLQKEFPELQHIKNVSVMEYKNMKKTDDYPLVISTIFIPDDDVDHIVVSPFLTNEEIHQIRTFINQYKILHGSEKAFYQDKGITGKEKSSFLNDLNMIMEYEKTIAVLLEGFELVQLSTVESIEKTLFQICQRLSKQGKVDAPDLVAKELLKREKLGALGIPDTSIGLYHTRSSHVLQPSLSIFSLKEPLEVRGMDKSIVKMKFILLLLSPFDLSEQGLEVLSQVSSMLIENDESISIFQSNNEEKVTQFLVKRWEQFLDKKREQFRRE